MIFSRKKRVEKFEEEFETENLKDKPAFYDLSLSSIEEPEELRSFLLESCRGKGYSISLNELTKFESEEFEGIFKGGTMKPIRGLLRTKKKVLRGIKHPILTALSIIATTLLIVLSFKPNLFNLGLEGKEQILRVGAIVSAFLFIIFYKIKRKFLFRIWVKLVGIHDTSAGKADIRLVLAGESEKGKRTDKVEEDLSSIYQNVTDMFLAKKLPKPEEEERILKKKEKNAQERVIEKLSQAVDSLDNLDSRFAKGEISEERYKELKEKLERNKSKYETLLDIVK